MKKDRVIDTIFDECLELIFSGETVEQCIRRYPEYEDELRPLLETVLDVQDSVAVEPRPEFKQKARYEFNQALRNLEEKQHRGWWLFTMQPAWALASVALLLIIIVGGGGTVAAASNAMPDNSLYQVKLATEQIQVALAGTDIEKAEVYARLADERVEEIIYSAGQGDEQQVELLTLQLSNQLNTATVLAGGALATNEAEVMVATTKDVPARAILVVPTEEAESVESDGGGMQDYEAGTFATGGDEQAEMPQVTTATADTEAEVEIQMFGASEVPPEVITEPAPERATVTSESNGLPVDGDSEFATVVRTAAASNTLKLEEALALVPDSVKPALENAIQQSIIDYDRLTRAAESAENQ